MKLRTPLVRLSLFLLLGSLGCVDGTIEKPQPPNVDVEQQRIANPLGTVNQENIGEVSRAAEESLDELAAVCGWDVLPMYGCETEACEVAKCDLFELVKGLIVVAAIFVGGDDVESNPSDPNAPSEDVPSSDNYINSAEGFGVVKRICDGYGSGDRTDPSNGKLELNIGFTDHGLDSVLWGVFTACRLTSNALGDVSIDGNVVIVTERPAGKANSDELIVVVDLTIAGFSLETRLFALYQDDQKAQTTRLYLPINGGVLFYRSPAGVGFEDQLGSVSCDFVEKVCTRGADEVMTW